MSLPNLGPSAAALLKASRKWHFQWYLSYAHPSARLQVIHDVIHQSCTIGPFNRLWRASSLGAALGGGIYLLDRALGDVDMAALGVRDIVTKDIEVRALKLVLHWQVSTSAQSEGSVVVG